MPRICFFDESLNEVSTKEQIEVHIISFDENTKQIKRNHIKTEINGHSDTETVVKAFKNPNRNWSMSVTLPRFQWMSQM